MYKILVIGAGRSATSLIDYLLKQAVTFNWQITVADVDIQLALEKVNAHKHGQAISFDIKNETNRLEVIKEHDFIISMLPAFMHGDVARDCVALGKHMATASYVSNDMKALDKEAREKKLLLLNECGLDPGIDHASAMKVIDEIKQQGEEIISFKSYCGGLVAPESNDNPWGYKFSWNPRNVILAGQGTAQYLQDGEMKFIPYNRLFSQTDTIAMEGYGGFDAYANRDSVGYMDVYGLNGIKTMLRGTLRQSGYCRAWNLFVKLGLTDDSSKINNANKLTYTSLLESFLPPGSGTLKERLKAFAPEIWNHEVEHKLDYLELFSNKKITLSEGTPAQLLQALLEEKWKLNEDDKDMIVMQHQFEYHLKNDNKKTHRLESSLVVIGKDNKHTAMALTVGLPLAITVKNFICKKFELYGVQIPNVKQIYTPMLSELEEHGIVFTEKQK
ncbi:MAG: saccharopine dehydrogenase NADP-binding domain-containing protein [Bacteroidia bacterium]|nr:saccharopine dehydrogenase NADP-binding domain-containing protein [Bacteroidia bacterium]